MRKHSDQDIGIRTKVVDLDTGQEIPFVRWADDETGEYGQIRHDKDGRMVRERGELVLDVKRGRIAFRPTSP